ncbi:MAG TPA: ABC transporter ATP-binding protein [Beijerinckiaceae bacterium]|nr:ABC transporter ATP-binding protein [Beijerinckiaceae bacterium]
MTETPLVHCTGLTKRFGSLVANDSVEVRVEQGEVCALLGENGAGKSTFVKMLYGLLRPDAGRIEWLGREVTLESPEEARRLGIGMVFQHFSLFEEMTVLENIALGTDGARADRALADKVTKVAETYGLQLDLKRPVWTLSAGERQRIEIARCLLQEPRLIVLDEPTSVLTPQESENLFKSLERLRDQGAGILFISHKLEEVRRLCTRATILRGGKLVGVADPRKETARSLAAMMVGEGFAEVRPAPEHAHGPAILSVSGLSVDPDIVHGMPLKDVALDVHAGEVVAVAGVAGNGQSELFAALSGEGGIVTGGTVHISGEDVTWAAIGRRRKLGAAYVPEGRLGHATIPQRTLSENIALSWHETEDIGGRVLSLAKLKAAAAEVIKRFDVRGPNADPRANQLSGGNLQKYIVGREIQRNPRLIVVDQPTWGVDARAAALIRQTLVDLAAKGAAVLAITQDLDEAFEISDRIAVIAEGRLHAPVATRATSREAVGLLMTAGHGDAHHGEAA